MARTPVLSDVLKTLRRRYGRPAPPISTDPFQLILWEQVAYLVPDPQRRVAFRALQAQVGLQPKDILAASAARLTAIARRGGAIAAADRAGRMRRSAELAVSRWNGNLKHLLKLPSPQARGALASFPMIGEPGADKILCITTSTRLLPLDSNGLRVLQRLGLSPPGRDYRHSYQAAQAALAAAVPRTRAERLTAYALLREHGQTLCRRNEPLCLECPLRASCPTGTTRSRST